MATINGDDNSNLLGGTGSSDLYNGLGGNDTVNAGGGADTLFGGTGNDNLSGQNGDDSILGEDGNDQLFGGNNNDLLNGGLGNDTLSGGDGTDTASYEGILTGVFVDLAAGTATGGAGSDSLTSIENAIGGDGADTLVGTTGANLLSGGLGNDILNGGLGNDTLAGGGGVDTVDYSNAAAAVNVDLTAGTATGGAGSDSLSSIENISGSAFNDTLAGSADGNAINGGAGDDSISALDGNDTVDGGAGLDTISGGAGNDSIAGGGGNDTITGGTGDDTITGGPETDPGTTPLDLNWSAFSNNTNVAGGFTQNTGGVNVTFSYTDDGGGTEASISTDETLYRAPGETFSTTSSLYLGGTGVGNTSTAEFNFATAPGGSFDPEVTNVMFRINDIDTGTWRDVVTVRAYDADGNEIVVSFTISGNETLSGNTITAGPGSDDPDEAVGSVLFTIVGPVAKIVIDYNNLLSGTQRINISDIQFEATATDNDFVQGEAGNDVISGGSGNDTLDGGADNDTLNGGAGNDSLIGGTGNDLIDGGAGNDTILFGSGDDTVYGGAGNDTIDDVSGGVLDGNNLVYADAGNDTVWTGDGNDTVYGGAGNDVLSGEGGNDSLYGDAGNDSLYGGDGNDTLQGGPGADLLSGGTGNDTFVIADGDANDGPLTETVDGGGTPGSGPGDYDTLDLSDYGWGRVDIVYTGAESGTVTFYAPDGVTIVGTLIFTEIENVIPCFTTGTMIATDRGDVAVETLQPGDLVLTRDHDLQPVRWIGQRRLSAADLVASPDLQPVRIARRAMDGTGPSRDMMVSPQHRILVAGAEAELLFGEAEVLVPARHLDGMAGVRRVLPAAGVTYVHLLFDRHEIVLSDGLWTESFQPAQRMMSALDVAVRAEVLALFPELKSTDFVLEAARPTLKAYEARVLLSL